MDSMREHAARVARLVALARRATPEGWRAGRAWYPGALDSARAMAPEDPAMAAGIIAALSPQTAWSDNLRRARRALAGDCAHTGAQCAKVRAMLGGAAPSDVLTGPKESAFYRAIMGDVDSITIDRHAARAVGLDRAPSAREFTEISAAYADASALYGESPRDFQATIWHIERGSAA